jgi:hypothetical protein
MEIDTISPTVMDAHLSVLVDDEPNLGTMAQLNHEGDTTYSWDRKNKAECDAAKEHFDSLRAKGFLAFKVNRMGCKQKKPTDTFESKAGKYIYTAPELATEFEPQANYVMTPQMNGG